MTERDIRRQQRWRLTLLAGLLAAQFAMAQPTTPVAIDIPPQPLAAALARFAEQSGLKTLYAAELLAGKSAPRVQGQLRPAAALQQLLAGSGLRFRAVANDAVVIEAAQAGEDATSALRPVTVRADSVGPAGAGYAAPVASTGTKLATPLMETPLNVQVITPAVLQERLPATLSEALASVSGVVAASRDLQYGAGERITLRGFSNANDFNTTGSYVVSDGLRTEGSHAAIQMADVESIEVLKGPAAILYGRIEPGGIVNVQTKKPRADAARSIEQQIGSWDTSRTRLDLTGPLNEDKTVLYRLNAAYERSGSWREGDVYARTGLIAPSFVWKLAPATEIGLDLKHDQTRAGEDYQATPWVDGRPAVMPWERNLNEPSPAKYRNDLVNLSLIHRFNDDWTLKARVAHARNDYDQRATEALSIDSTGGAAPWTATRLLLSIDWRRKSDVINADLTGQFEWAGMKHRALFGADVSRTRSNFAQGLGITDADGNLSTIDVQNPDHSGPPLVIDPASLRWNALTLREQGLYAQDQVELAPGVHLLVGLRWQRMKSDVQDTGSYMNSDQRTESATTPRLGVVWQLQPWLSLWGSYSEGFGAGYGRQYPGSAMPPTGAKQYEAGVKLQAPDGAWQGTLAVFDLTKTNVATKDTDPTHLPPDTWQVPIGKARSRGLELDFQGRLTTQWSLIAGYAYTDARITSNEAQTFRVGDRLAGVPRHMLNLWTTYAFSGADAQGWRVGAGANWRSDTAVDRFAPDAPQQVPNPGYTVANAMVSYAFKLGANRATAQLNIDNLFNRKYWNLATEATEWAYINFGSPRSAMASLKVEF